MSDRNLDFIFERRSQRNFTDAPLKEEDLEVLMESLRWAPSGGNCQPWYFYVVKDEETKKGLADAAYGQSFMADAPVIFVVCAIPEESGRRYKDRGRELYCIQDTAAAVENLLLAATRLGYGSCWVGAFMEDEVSKVLNIPEEKRPVAMVPVGKGEKPSAPSRKPKEEIFEFIEG